MCFYTPLTTTILSLLFISLALDVGGWVGWLVVTQHTYSVVLKWHNFIQYLLGGGAG
jgi:hypothetical protein